MCAPKVPGVDWHESREKKRKEKKKNTNKETKRKLEVKQAN